MPISIGGRHFRLYPQKPKGHMWECMVAEGVHLWDEPISTGDYSQTDTLASAAEYLMIHVLNPEGDIE